MSNDRAFTIYALGLIAAVASVITATVTVGVAAMPDLSVLAEHVGLGLAVRTSYKSFAGPDFFLSRDRVSETLRTLSEKIATGTPADAMS